MSQQSPSSSTLSTLFCLSFILHPPRAPSSAVPHAPRAPRTPATKFYETLRPSWALFAADRRSVFAQSTPHLHTAHTPFQPVDFDGEVNLFHFVLLRCVGKGAFGKVRRFAGWLSPSLTGSYYKVRVVQHKQTRDLYALKYINKAKCVKMKAVANIIQERRLLEEIDHAFVVNMRYAFQDDENCFFVLDLMLGGDLRCASSKSVSEHSY